MINITLHLQDDQEYEALRQDYKNLEYGRVLAYISDGRQCHTILVEDGTVTDIIGQKQDEDCCSDNYETVDVVKRPELLSEETLEDFIPKLLALVL
ncbi:hypothetical protein [Clostridium porci]|uniref:Uncharacterized protein n=1 Tax=Clostridium porci TaxID=2605778 RepID=A0A7X2NKI1_9CLOT|nr:hypothetical protein [Clostridium porci]MSS36507.1 hypothetical protein [Clostridium porci]